MFGFGLKPKVESHMGQEENCPYCITEGQTVIMELHKTVDDQLVYYCPRCDAILTKEELDAIYEEIYKGRLKEDNDETGNNPH